jgi:hypothetical protein
MKELFGAWNPEARRFHAPVKNIRSCNQLLDFGVKKYVILQYPDTKYPKPTDSTSNLSHSTVSRFAPK